jgi:hypothetical protein
MQSEKYCDNAPHQVYAKLLDGGRIIKAEHGFAKERRRQVQRPKYAKPELLATQPNQVWSWDITNQIKSQHEFIRRSSWCQVRIVKQNTLKMDRY